MSRMWRALWQSADAHLHCCAVLWNTPEAPALSFQAACSGVASVPSGSAPRNHSAITARCTGGRRGALSATWYSHANSHSNDTWPRLTRRRRPRTGAGTWCRCMRTGPISTSPMTRGSITCPDGKALSCGWRQQIGCFSNFVFGRLYTGELCSFVCELCSMCIVVDALSMVRDSFWEEISRCPCRLLDKTDVLIL